MKVCGITGYCMFYINAFYTNLFPLICIKAVAFTCVWATLTSKYHIFKACSEPFEHVMDLSPTQSAT